MNQDERNERITMTRGDLAEYVAERVAIAIEGMSEEELNEIRMARKRLRDAGLLVG